MMCDIVEGREKGTFCNDLISNHVFPRVEHLAKSLNFNLSFKSIHSVACCRLK